MKKKDIAWVVQASNGKNIYKTKGNEITSSNTASNSHFQRPLFTLTMQQGIVSAHVEWYVAAL